MTDKQHSSLDELVVCESRIVHSKVPELKWYLSWNKSQWFVFKWAISINQSIHPICFQMSHINQSSNPVCFEWAISSNQAINQSNLLSNEPYNQSINPSIHPSNGPLNNCLMMKSVNFNCWSWRVQMDFDLNRKSSKKKSTFTCKNHSDSDKN